jgi:hypothetical protein
VDYVLKPPLGQKVNAGRIVPPRPSNLRAGGGRIDTPGWTPHKRRSSRARFDALRSFIKTGVTIGYPEWAPSEQLIRFNCCSQEFCKEYEIPARSVWEGPRKHHHIALGIDFNPEIDRAWKARLSKRWRKIFGEEMPSDAFLWEPGVRPDKIASYLSKTFDDAGRMVKGRYPWLTFNPVWETGFRKLVKPSEKQEKKIACQYSSGKRGEVGTSPRKKRGKPSKVQTSEKEGETGHSGCATCWPRWGRSLWRQSCECQPPLSPDAQASLNAGGDLHTPVRPPRNPASPEDPSSYAP